MEITGSAIIGLFIMCLSWKEEEKMPLICITVILLVLGLVVLNFGFVHIVDYSAKVRTIVFWTMNIVAGILLMDMIVSGGKYIHWVYFGVVYDAAWYVVAIKPSRDYIYLREVISKEEDITLFVSAILICIGLPMVGRQIADFFLLKAM